MSTTLVRKWNPTFQTLNKSLFCTIPNIIDSNLNVKAVSELIEKRKWSDLKTHHLKDSNPTEFLRKLMASKLNPDLISTYFSWSQQKLNASHPLDLTFTLINSLASSQNFLRITPLITNLITEEEEEQEQEDDKHTIFAFFHYLSLSVDRPHRDILVDMLISSCVSISKTQMGLEAFRRAGDYGYNLSPVSCDALLDSLVRENQTKKVEFVYNEMIKRRIKVDLKGFCIVINGLCKANQMLRASEVFKDMKFFGIEPNLVTYNTLINGFSRNKTPGNMYKADAFLKEMIEKKIAPDLWTYNTMIAGFVADGNFPAAWKVFDEMSDRGLKPDVVTYSTLISGLCKAGRLGEALLLRDEMVNSASPGSEPNIVTYNTLLHGLCRNERLDKARELFESLEPRGVSPDVVTYSTMIDAYCKNGDCDEAFRILGLMKERKVFPNTTTFSSLIGGLFRAGDFKRAREIFGDLEHGKMGSVRPNLATYNIIIGQLCDRGRSKDAKRVLDGLFSKTKTSPRPSHLTYNTVMKGFFMEGNVKAAMEIKLEMTRKRKLRPNVATYNVLVKGLCSANRLKDANAVLNEMLEKGLVPNKTTYDILRAENEDKGFVPDIDGHLRSFFG